MRGIQRVSTKGMSREEWLMRRRKTIGGSDAAGIVGVFPMATPIFLGGENFRSELRTGILYGYDAFRKSWNILYGQR